MRLRNRAGAAGPTLAEGGDRYVCYAAMANAFVIRANGQLARCTSSLTDTRNNIGTLLPDGTMQVDQQRSRAWLSGWSNEDWTALQCPLTAIRAERQFVPLQRR